MSAKKARPVEPGGPMGGLGGNHISHNAANGPLNPMRHAASLPTAAVLSDVKIWAASVGSVVAGRCHDCGQVIWGAESIHTGRGRVCRRRARKAAREQVTP